MKKLTFLLIASAFTITAYSQSFTALYSFDSVKTTSGLIDPTSVPTAPGITFGSFSAFGTPANPNASARFSFTGWPKDSMPFNDVYSSLAGVINTSQYYEVTLTPSSGFAMTLSGITFKAQRSGTGIRTYSVRSNDDSYAANLQASIAPANTNLSVQTGNIFYWNLDAITSGQNGSTITLSGPGFTNSSSAKTFRFYGWNAEGSGGTFGIDTVKFSGSASALNSIREFSSDISASVYPNPSETGLFTVDLAGAAIKTIVTVYNIIGKTIFTKELNFPGRQTIDLSNEASGSYFINIKNDNSVITRKITINR